MPQLLRVRPSWALIAVAVGIACADAFQTSAPTTRIQRVGTLGLSAQADEVNDAISNQRRKLIQQSSAAFASLLVPILPAFAEEETTTTRQPSEPYTRAPSPNDKFKFSYTITPPPGFGQGNKPLKTHLDEINFSPEGIRGYTCGITVDPVRISKIQEFGTPEEVAARVVTAEINRDGIFDVKLAKDATEDKEAGWYDIEYTSAGKRGTKRIVTRIYIQGGFLYALTVQSKEAEYDKAREEDVLACVKSFKPL